MKTAHIESLEGRRLLAAVPVLTGEYHGSITSGPDRPDAVVVNIIRQTGRNFSGTLTIGALAAKVSGSIAPNNTLTLKVSRSASGPKVSGDGTAHRTGLGKYAGQLNLSVSDSEAGGAFSVSLFDSDDAIREASAIVIGAKQTLPKSQIESITDVDMRSFIAEPGMRLGFGLRAKAGSKTYLRLFDSKGKQLSAAGVNPAHPEYDAFLNYIFTKRGRYYIGVSSRLNKTFNANKGIGDKAGTVFSYRMTVSPIDTDGRIVDARALGPISGSTTFTDTIIQGAKDIRDVDIFSFEAEAGQHLAIETAGLSDGPGGAPSNQAFLRIFDASGAELINSTSDHLGESYVDFVFPSSGTYYAGVSAQSNPSYDPLKGSNLLELGPDARSYRLSFILNPGSDDPDDQTGEATTVDVSAAEVTHITGDLSSNTDVDAFEITLAANQQVRAIFNGTGDTSQFVAAFHSANGTLISTGDLIDQAAGTYYVLVRSIANVNPDAPSGRHDTGAGAVPDATGPYDLSIVRYTGSDSDGVPNLATPIATNGAPVQGGIDVPGDIDFYSFNAVAGQQLSVQIVGSSGFVAVVSMFPPGPRGVSSPEPASFDRALNTTGLWYIGVSASDNTLYYPDFPWDPPYGQMMGTYTLTVAVTG